MAAAEPDPKPVVLAKDVPNAPNKPTFGPGSTLHWDDPEQDPTLRPHIGTSGTQKVQAAEFGPGSKVNWDNAKADPNKRKNVGQDPTGVANAKLT